MAATLITGATGFLGRALSSRLIADGCTVRGSRLATEPDSALAPGVEPVVIGSLGAATPLEHALVGIETVFHLAARVHVMHETASDPLREFREVNTAGTENLARQAAALGVRRFVFMSTIGINGDHSGTRSFSETDPPQPHNNYSVSKLEAENILKAIAASTGMEVVIIRAPLVYGPGNPGNFLSLLQIVQRGIPLPLASVANRRSLIYVGNLVDSLATCRSHPSAAGQSYLVSDMEDISTPELIRRTAAALGVPARLFPFPLSLLRLAGQLTGKGAAVNQLTGSLTVNGSKIRSELNWQPPFNMNHGLKETARWYLNTHGAKS